MITVIVIPADARQPLRLEQCEATDLPGFQALVEGGYIEPIELFRPAAALYVNEEGRSHGLAPNPRATALAWVHNSMFQGGEMLVGDVLVTGPPDAAGNDTSAPEPLAAVLLRAPLLRVQVRRGSKSWAGSRRTFDSVSSAYLHALRLAACDQEVVDVRVIPADAPHAACSRAIRA